MSSVSKIKLPDNTVLDIKDGRMGNARIFHGTCSTAGATAAKVVSCTDFISAELVKGALIFVTFSYTNSATAADLTMDVNSTGAKSIKKQGNSSSTNDLAAVGEIRANSTYLFHYDGTNWVCISLDYNSTYSALTEADMKAGTATTGRTITAARVKQAVEYWMVQNQIDWDESDSTSPSYIAHKPSIPSAVTESTVAGWGFTKNEGTLTGVSFNGSPASVTGGVASITVSIPSAPGTLDTTATIAQSTSASEALSGSVTLHKVAKTGTYSDLIGTPTIPTASSATPAMDGMAAAGSETAFARGDHVHPSDSSKADVSVAVTGVGYDTTNHKITKTINGATTDVVTAGTIVTDGGGITQHQDISGKEDKTNKVTSISSSSTDTEYPSAKCVYDIVGDIETLLAAL